jgi:hypothetical protein
MHEMTPDRSGVVREKTDCFAVDRERCLAFGLGAVDRRVRGGVNHDIGPMLFKRDLDGARRAQVERIAAKPEAMPTGWYAAQKRATQLAMSAGDQRLHASGWNERLIY